MIDNSESVFDKFLRTEGISLEKKAVPRMTEDFIYVFKKGDVVVSKVKSDRSLLENSDLEDVKEAFSLKGVLCGE